MLYNHASFAMLRWSNSKGFNLILLVILNIPSKPVRAHFAGMLIGGEKPPGPRRYAGVARESGGTPL